MVKFKHIAGLSDADVLAQRKEHGANELPPPEVEGFWDKLKENFEDPIIRILLVALGITMVLAFLGYADWIEGIGIAVAVFLATFVSTYSEYKNENSFRLLQEQASQVKNNVFRNGHPVKIFATEIVVGDSVLLQAGDKIPADGKLSVGELLVNQSSLTGEAQAARKIASSATYSGKDRGDFYDEKLCFKGSVVEDGEAVLRVESVGIKTLYGELFSELADAEERESPLQVKLSALADGVAMFGYIGATAIAISFLFKQFVIDQGYNWARITAYVSLANWHVAFHDVVTSIILAIIVIVVAVPEGLPMMIAIVLSLNMRRLLRAKVLVRKLLGIETAGSIDLLFVDKTGTLTKGQFQPVAFISGSGASSKSASAGSVAAGLRDVVTFCIRESTSAVITDEGVAVGGNASDRALLGFLEAGTLRDKVDATIVREILFNSERKFSAAQLRLGRAKPAFLQGLSEITIVKGAPDFLLPHCKHYYTNDARIERLASTEPVTDAINRLSKGGIRVIAIATATEGAQQLESSLPSSLALVGVIGIMDEIRAESKPSIELCRSAGIHVVMITGDRKETAVAVGQELGLLDDDRAVLTSDQLKGMSDEHLQKLIPTVGVIARALPTDKSRLVRVCQAANRVVGMTGDGVNDSAALKTADVGFAMGSGSEVAKEASDIVILDDNFHSITQAVLFGRTIFKSIRKFIVFQSTVNAASMIIVFMGPFLGFDFPLTLIQLLWVNLVMDTLAAMAFGGEPPLRRYMHEHPIRRDEHIISKSMWSAIIVNGIFIASLCIGALKMDWVRSLFIRNGSHSDAAFFTAFFALFIFLTNFNAFNARVPHSINIFEQITGNSGFVLVVFLIFTVQVVFTYVGGKVLRTVGLTPQEWASIISVSALILPFDTARKIITLWWLTPAETVQKQERKRRE